MKLLYRSLWAIVAWTSIASALPTEVNTPEPDAVTLHPVAIRDYEAAMGVLERRESEDFSDLDPQTQSKLIYGTPGSGGQKLLAEMTLYAPNGLQIVSMEKFEPFTKSVDCSTVGDGKLSLVFKSRSVYDYALRKWSFINEKGDDKFLLIANHAGCGPEAERQPYYVRSVNDSPGNNTVDLFATEAPWSEVAGTYDLSFGQTAAKVKPRGWWDDVKDGLGDAYDATTDTIEDVGNGIADAVQGNADFAKSLSFSVAAGQANQRSALYHDPDGRLKLDCVSCYTGGKFKVTGHLKVESWDLKDLSIDASPQDFAAEMKLEATISASKTPLSLGNQKELFSAPVPYAGISVPKIFKLGAVFSYSVGFNTTIKGDGVVDFGLKASLPNTAKATLDLDSVGKSSATGFDGALTPLFSVQSLSASVEVAAFSTPKLSFGIELSNIGKASIALSMKLPEVSSTLTAKYAAAGACKGSKSKTGIDLSNQVTLALSAEANAALGEDEDSSLPKWSDELWSKPFALPGDCWPMPIPGLAPASNQKAAAAPSPKAKPKAKAKTEPTTTKKAAPAPTKKKADTATSSAPPATGGGGCRKVKRDRLGRRMLVAC